MKALFSKTFVIDRILLRISGWCATDKIIMSGNCYNIGCAIYKRIKKCIVKITSYIKIAFFLFTARGF